MGTWRRNLALGNFSRRRVQRRFSASVALRRSSLARAIVGFGALPLTFPRGFAARAPSSPPRGEEILGSLAGEALVIVGGLADFEFGGVVGVVRFPPALEAGPLASSEGRRVGKVVGSSFS